METGGFNMLLLRIVIYLAWNIITGLLMGIDKLKAKGGYWRISEKTLLISAILMGGLGTYCGSKIFKHKTQKKSFKIMLSLAIIVNIATMAAIIYLKVSSK